MLFYSSGSTPLDVSCNAMKTGNDANYDDTSDDGILDHGQQETNRGNRPSHKSYLIILFIIHMMGKAKQGGIVIY